jgi:multidrug resistance efflux pump
MAWLQNTRRKALYAVGGGLLVGSLLGARLLTHGGGGGTTAAAPPAGPTNGKDGSGPVVLGIADSNPSPISFGLPPVLPSGGQIVKVFVTAGQEVKVREYVLFGGKLAIGDPLYKFNSQMLDAKLVDANMAVNVAVANLRGAQAKQDQHKIGIDVQKLKLKAAELNMNRTQEGYHLYERVQRDALTMLHGAEKAKQLLRDDPERYKLETAYLRAEAEKEAESEALTALQKADVGAAVAIAEAQVKAAEAMVDEARTAVDMCTVRTQIPGTIERVNFGAGASIGISTRTPAVILVPAGPRIVRAEIEADFAHRIGRDKIGKEVTVYDNTDPKITYKGKVERIGDTFLPKRGASESLAPNDTLVIEAIVVVADANPPGVPPLRVGQKVRVNFGN